jgi:DNA-binding NarL/FixJ family response regulator
MRPVRVLLADDHALVRAGFRTLLESIAGVHVVADADNGQDALRLIGLHRPDIAIMDISMPGLNGLEATARVSAEFASVRVIILSMHANEEYVLRALQAGAAGYLLKDADPVELELAVAAVARGDTYLSPPVSRHVIDDYVRRVSNGRGPLDSLTPRQREVLQLIAEGNTTRQMAQVLGVSAKTVETHRAQLMERLDIHDIAGLVRFAVRTGVVSAEE